MAEALHLNLDNAWLAGTLPVETVDATSWGPLIRFCAPGRLIENFYRAHDQRLASFLLYGSGDFHHLTALWLRHFEEELTVVSFDNHPDWDVRPPKWCCGAWVNRALELPQVKKVSVWGCGNFECWWPGQIFGNRCAENLGKLEVHPWADDRPRGKQERRGAIFRANWRNKFERFVEEIARKNVYVTVDLDCLRADEAVTNWENGKFKVDDVVWALGRLRSGTRIVGGDVCGAYSEPNYARAKQRLVATIDHPKLPAPDPLRAREINLATVEKLLPVLASE